MVHNTGDEDIEGYKRFKGRLYVETNGSAPYIHFNGVGNTDDQYMGIIGLNGAGNGETFGNPYYRFYERSAEADGTGVTSAFERYDLPSADAGLSSSVTYNILTTKRYNVGIGNVNPNSPKDVTFSDTTYMLLIGMSGNANRCYFGLVYGSTGTPVVVDIHKGSSITVTPGTGKITITTTSSYNTYFFGYYLNGRGGM